MAPGGRRLIRGGSQLYGQGQAVEAGADLGDDRSVLLRCREPGTHRSRSIQEQRDGLVRTEAGGLHPAGVPDPWR